MWAEEGEDAHVGESGKEIEGGRGNGNGKIGVREQLRGSERGVR